MIAARVEGGDVVLLACPTNLEPIYLITRPEIKSPADLKGKSSGDTVGLLDPLLSKGRSVPKEFFGRPELFRDNAPLERVLGRQAP